MNTLLILLQSIDGASIAKFGIALGAAIIVLAAGLGIGRIGSSALKSIARQPEASGDIRTNMIVSAALIEGVAFFALIILIVALFV
ncbi:ATP synthase F0 subunit C [Tenuifilum osseticum]|jgi:F-type H+-transporting ATPase subunit c|uniref:ATP synthase F0 subunit C n=1 Tax=Tenuifilum TaxID=2760873 RepID=UPI001986E4DA|nr:ATP synthase F0 subunit C [Bacteroidales bacterium]HOU73477.1 ATP synthase F0 subunit C [Tenuifilum sp.]MBP7168915.1 ATP synthase F0 subunit C [Bacteroidales bacterium]MBP9028193.1 ATP synthase F0 subunit C [Bacteroidales bacterium]HQE53799.1 ATP synthase F0 subunit C [Tenuifilum sp.]